MSLHLDRAHYEPEITVTQIRFQGEQRNTVPNVSWIAFATQSASNATPTSHLQVTSRKGTFCEHTKRRVFSQLQLPSKNGAVGQKTTTGNEGRFE